MSIPISVTSPTSNSNKSAPSLIAQDIYEESCKRNALYWAQHFTQTENPLYLEQGLPFRAPFPEKSYFIPLFSAFSREKRLFVPKSRDMMTSWSAMVWATHQAQWNHAFAVVQTMKEDKAIELIGYAECLYRNQPDWLRARHPLKSKTSTEIVWEDSGRVLGVPAGEHQIRTYHPTIYIMDEGSFLPEAEQCYNCAKASSPNIQMLAVSSAGPGWFGDECSL